MPTNIERLRAHPKAEIVDDERGIGNGVILTLRQGPTFSPGQNNRVRGEDTSTTMLKAMRETYAFSGPFEN